MEKKVAKIRYKMTLKEIQKELESIGFSTNYFGAKGKDVAYIEVFKT